MTTYTTTKVKFDELSKKVNRIFKKLSTIGGNFEFSVVREFVKEVPVYVTDEITQTIHKVDTVLVDCVEYILNFDSYKVGDYRFGAVVERTDDEKHNLVYVSDDAINYEDYVGATLRCEHCNTKHNRTKCVVLIDNNNGTHKMVGTGCLRDFIGYNVEMFAKYFKEIEQIIEENTEPEIYGSLGAYKCYIDTKEYLAYCIDIIRKSGYAKDVKSDALVNMRKETKIDDESRKIANTVINFFESHEATDPFENNTKLYVTGKHPVCYENGIIAYAYELYKKILDRIEKEKADEVRKSATEYVGNVGDKINITGTITRAGHFESDYGTVIIFKIVDEDNNVFVWKTTAGVCIPSDAKVMVRGTVKEHSEYNGEKQTVLTRCKITECVPA